MYRVVEQNLRAAMRCYGYLPDGEICEPPGLAITSSGFDVPVFNSAMLTGPTADIERLILTADVHFHYRDLGWTFWVCEDLLPLNQRGLALQLLFQSKRMRRIADPPGMYAERILPATKLPAPMTFSTVASERTRLEFVHIASTVFSLSFVTAQRIYGGTEVWQPPSQGWIGYANDMPVAIVTLVIAAGAIGVYSLGTLPQYRGRGYGETLLRHAMAEADARTGLQRSVLQSTTQGLGLYRRMGYVAASRFSIYMRESCDPF